MVKNKIKQEKHSSEDVKQVKNLIILLIIAILVCVGVFFLTEKLLKNETTSNDIIEDVKIDYDIATIGTMFNRPENEYYVLLYSSKEDGSEYDSILAKYRSSDNYKKTYFVDLDKKINNHVLKDKLNETPANSEEVSVKGATLYKIKEGKVINCYKTLESIKDTLK